MASTSSASSCPFIRIVILAFDGADMTLECIESVLASEWPLDCQEIVLVDNGSLDDGIERVRRLFPQVRIVEPLANLGFAGGCNAGIRADSASDGTSLKPFDYVALVNNDAVVTKGWLNPLISVLENDAGVGAAVPKMLLYHHYYEVEVSALFANSLDHEDEPVCVSGARLNSDRNDSLLAFDEGFGGSSPFSEIAGEEFARWATNGGRIRFVAPQDTSGEVRLSLRVGARVPGWIKLRIDGIEQVVQVGPGPSLGPTGHQWVECVANSAPVDVINNVGSDLFVGGSAGDRGFLERDFGQYDQSCEVFAWCGGAVLLRKAYLDEVGLFDEAFFLYYEDTDLSWRGRLQGWRYTYTPESVVRHRHAQSSGVGSDLFRFQVERNRLLVLTKNAPLTLVVRSVAGEVKRFVSSAWRDVVLRVLVLRRPIRREFGFRLRILRSFLFRLPGVLSDRWMMDIRVSRRKVMKWATPKVVMTPAFEPPVSRFEANFLSTEQIENTRPTAAIYNQYWTTYGGGEVVSGGFARALLKQYDVVLLGPEEPDFEIFHQRLGVDLSGCSWRQVNGDDEAAHASGEYSVFVNTTYQSRAVNASPLGLYYVHFPGKHSTSMVTALLGVSVRFGAIGSRLPLLSSKFKRLRAQAQAAQVDPSWADSYAKLLVNSQYTQVWVNKIWKQKSAVLYPPVSPVVSPGEKSPLIASIGRFFDPTFGHSKKQFELVSAFTAMIESQAGVGDWSLSLVGGADSKSRDFVMKVRQAARNSPIEIYVNAPRRKIEDVLSQSSIYWHASGFGEDPKRHPERFEHFGISVVEAMAAGAVPVVFGAAGPMEIVRHGVDGFHWHTFEELIVYTRQLMDDEPLRKSMSLSACLRAAEFGIDRFEQEVNRIVKEFENTPYTR